MFACETGFPTSVSRLPSRSQYYLLCRHAIASLCAAQPSRPVLWLPTFFCPDVAHFCCSVAEIREYRDDCRWPEPDWKSLQPKREDLVLAVNYFGVRGAEPWIQWRAQHSCILIEDHTQDPVSSWSLQSSAEYAVCSLRKTLPIPDGAIAWSPMNCALPKAPTHDNWAGSILKMSAMLYKRNYLDGTLPADCKGRYRELQLKGEKELGSTEISSMSPLSESILALGIPKLWRKKRVENACALLQALEGWKSAVPVFTRWPKGHAPFDLPLVFSNSEARDRFQRALQEQDIFCPVEWVCDTSDAAASELSSRILSIPIDHRYTVDDMAKVSAALLNIVD